MMVLGVAACGSSAPEQFRWHLDLDSTGGIGGRGQGHLVVTSEGKVVTSRSGRSCSASLDAGELRSIQQAVGSVAPGNWQTEYLPAKTQQCCDRISWHLEVTLEMPGGTKRSAYAHWHEDALHQLPPDLRTLAIVAQRVLDRGIQLCRNG
jgi:hypothetical protein